MPVGPPVSIPVVNPSFEDDPIDVGPGWINVGIGGWRAGIAPTGWTTTLPGAGQHWFAPGFPPLPIPASDGNMFAYINEGQLAQTLTANFDNTKFYTLSVDVNKRSDMSNPVGQLQLFAGPTLLVSRPIPSMPDGTWGNFVMNFEGWTIPNGAPEIGAPLSIRVVNLAASQIGLDNFKLSSTPVATEKLGLVDPVRLSLGSLYDHLRMEMESIVRLSPPNDRGGGLLRGIDLGIPAVDGSMLSIPGWNLANLSSTDLETPGASWVDDRSVQGAINECMRFITAPREYQAKVTSWVPAIKEASVARQTYAGELRALSGEITGADMAEQGARLTAIQTRLQLAGQSASLGSNFAKTYLSLIS